MRGDGPTGTVASFYGLTSQVDRVTSPPGSPEDRSDPGMIAATDPAGGAGDAGETDARADGTCIMLIGDAQAEVGPGGEFTLHCIDGAVWLTNTGYPGVALVAGESYVWRDPAVLRILSLAAFTRVRVRPQPPVPADVPPPDASFQLLQEPG
jgi:hypothetical protein